MDTMPAADAMEMVSEMDVASTDMEHVTSTLPTILCCLCGTAITANPSNMCISCIRGQVDITETIPKQSSIYYCKGCARYLQPPKHWVAAELESKELLTLCLKRLKGLNKVKLIDAGFRWTEPHSRRIQVRLLVQKQVFSNTILQQEFVVEFVVEYQQCDMCRRDAADLDEWQAVVQARQKVPHKRTFLYLEQLILKYNAHENTVGIKVHPDGLDFYFMHRSQGIRFVSFLNHVVPMRHKMADHLVSHDANSNTYRYKYTFSAEIVPLCKDDLCCLPHKLSVHLGGIGPVVIVTKISMTITLMDPMTLQTAELSSIVYWKHPFMPLMSVKQATEFYVLDVDLSEERRGKWQMADATVARSADYGKNDITHYIRTHIGHFIRPGDLALGYDVGNAVYNETLVEGHKRLQLPEFVLFKKTYSKRDRSKKRQWRLKRLNMQLDESMNEHVSTRRGIMDPIAKMAMEQEEFMQDLEQDNELRSGINLFKDPTMLTVQQAAGMAREGASVPESAAPGMVLDEGDNDAEDEEEYPEVPIEELLDGLVLEDEPGHYEAPEYTEEDGTE